MEGEITEHENSYQVITNTAQDAIITIDKSNVITFANPASVKVFGYQISELIGKDATRLMPEALGSSQLREFFSPGARRGTKRSKPQSTTERPYPGAPGNVLCQPRVSGRVFPDLHYSRCERPK
ncbi:MAG: PAS domain S-box protein [Pseudomonadales bacterium]